MVSEILLENYQFLLDSDIIEIRDLLIDLNQALKDSDLSELEREVINATYLSVHEPPIRTGKRGRPRRSGLQGETAVQLKDMLKTVLSNRGRKIKGQTEYHDLHRSIKQYKKVLIGALNKIEETLEYGGTVELPTSALRHMPKRYLSQI